MFSTLSLIVQVSGKSSFGAKRLVLSKRLNLGFNARELLDIFIKDKRNALQLKKMSKIRSLEETAPSYDQKLI